MRASLVWGFFAYKKILGRTETRTRDQGCTSGGYDQFETSPEAIGQELRPAVCERRQTKANYSVPSGRCLFLSNKQVLSILPKFLPDLTPGVATFINRAIEVTAGSANPVTHAAREAGKTPFRIPASLLFLRDVVNSRESESTQFIPAVKTIFPPLKSVNFYRF